MTAYTQSDRSAWLRLIEDGRRLDNPKIRDFGPLKRSARTCRMATFPPGYSYHGSPFSRLIRSVESLPGTPNTRDTVRRLAAECDKILSAENPADADPTPPHQRRSDIYG